MSEQKKKIQSRLEDILRNLQEYKDYTLEELERDLRSVADSIYYPE